MRRALASRATFVGLLLFFGVSSASAQQTITIRVLNLADLNRQTLRDAQAIADLVWASAGVDARWRSCDTRPCEASLGPVEVWLRVAPGVARDDGWLTTETLAYWIPGERPGTLATVFVGSIADLADEGGLWTQELLGVIVAHTIADLIRGESTSRVVRPGPAPWSARGLRSLFRQKLHLSRDEAASLREAMRSRVLAR